MELPPVPAIYYQEDFKHPESAFDLAFKHILSVEGCRVSHHKEDKGGVSKFGITRKALAEYLKQSVSEEKIRALTMAQAKSFYFDVYWRGLQLERIRSLAVAIAVLDQLTHRGPFGGASFTQRFINKISGRKVVPVSGIITSETIQAINNISPHEFVMRYFKHAQRSYISIVQRDATQIKFLRGWLERTYALLGLLSQEAQS